MTEVSSRYHGNRKARIPVPASQQTPGLISCAEGDLNSSRYIDIWRHQEHLVTSTGDRRGSWRTQLHENTSHRIGGSITPSIGRGAGCHVIERKERA